MQDFTPKPLVYNTNQPLIPKLEKPLTLQQAKSLPQVAAALDRWEPITKKDAKNSQITENTTDKNNLALNYLANPMKVGLRDFAINVALFAVLPEVIFHGVELLCHKLPNHMPKTITNAMTKYGKGIGMLLLLESAISTVIQIPLSLWTANQQKETNKQALAAIEKNGITAKFGDADQAKPS